MTKLRQNQHGFSGVEAVLLLVVVGIIGFTGVYVWHAKNSADKTLTANNSTVPVFKKKATPTSVKSGVTAPQTTFAISELGIKIVNVPTSINDLTDYQYASNSSIDPNNTTKTPVKFTAVQFSTQSLTNADPACSAKTGTSIGALARTNGTYVNNGPVDNGAFVKQFSGFYITYSHPEAVCSNNASAEAIHVSQTATFESLVTNPANLTAL